MENRIPKIPKKILEERAKLIKPVVRFAYLDKDGFPTFNENKGKLKRYKTGLLYYIKNVDIFDVAFTWEPEPVKRADELAFLDAIVTYHGFAAPAFFKPLIAEVLAQIPEKYLGKVAAFETVSADLDCTYSIDSYHYTLTRLYKKSSP